MKPAPASDEVRQLALVMHDAIEQLGLDGAFDAGHAHGISEVFIAALGEYLHVTPEGRRPGKATARNHWIPRGWVWVRERSHTLLPRMAPHSSTYIVEDHATCLFCRTSLATLAAGGGIVPLDLMRPWSEHARACGVAWLAGMLPKQRKRRAVKHKRETLTTMHVERTRERQWPGQKMADSIRDTNALIAGDANIARRAK